MLRIIFFIFFLLSFQISLAEPALVRAGVSEGQGWVFQDAGRCWVATPSHVLGDSSNAIIIGPDGKQGQSTLIYRHPTQDLAILNVQGSLAKSCPYSSKGDRDTSHVLKRLQSQGKTINFERRVGVDDGGAFGLDIIPVEVIAISDADKIFTIRTLRDDDAVIQSDSGSPVRMRGSGVGEAGLPLGLVIADEGAIEDGYISVLRMDVVRDFYDATITNITTSNPFTLKKSQPIGSSDISFTIEGFTGETLDPSCGPLNLVKKSSDCGWRVSRKGYGDRPSLTLGLAGVQSLSAVEFAFGDITNLTLFSLQTRVGDTKWSIARPCRIGDSQNVSCSLGERKADQIKIVFEGRKFEVNMVKVQKGIN